jgi:hypothetical protein
MKNQWKEIKKLVAGEEDQIIMKKNPEVDYIASSKGYWYSYETANEVTPDSTKGDVVL